MFKTTLGIFQKETQTNKNRPKPSWALQYAEIILRIARIFCVVLYWFVFLDRPYFILCLSVYTISQVQTKVRLPWLHLLKYSIEKHSKAQIEKKRLKAVQIIKDQLKVA